MYKTSIRNGFYKGLSTVWSLAKIIVPVYFFVTFLHHTPLLYKISNLCEPAMKILGLPGEASLALVIGNFVNLFAGIGVMLTLELSSKQATILAIMLTIAHGQVLESAVAKKVGVSLALVVVTRLAVSFILGMLFNIIL